MVSGNGKKVEFLEIAKKNKGKIISETEANYEIMYEQHRPRRNHPKFEPDRY